MKNISSSSFRQGIKRESNAEFYSEDDESPLVVTPQQLSKVGKLTFTRDVLILNQTCNVSSKPLSRSELRWYNKPAGQFVVRKQLVQEMGEVFLPTSMPTRNRALVLCGDAGVGKTSVAQNYFSHPSKPYHFMAWFNAKSEGALIQQYLELAYQARFLQKTEQQDWRFDEKKGELCGINSKRLIEKVHKGLREIAGFCHLKLSLIQPQDNTLSLGDITFFQDDVLNWCYYFKISNGSIQSGMLKKADDDVMDCLTKAGDMLNKLNRQTIEPYYLDDLITLPEKLRQRIIECTTYSNYFHPSCLLVFDGVPEYAMVEDFLPTHNTEIIITSREKHWPGFKKLNVDVMEYIEAFTLVKMKLDSEDDETDAEDIEKLVTHVGYLPSQLIAVTQEIVNSGMSIKQYLEINAKRSSLSLY